MAKKRVFIVEDEEDILELLRYHLEREGYSVTTSVNGEDALAAVPAAMPHLILLDLMLPGLDGLEVCRRLKRDNLTADIPVIMVTAKGEEGDVVTGLELGAEDYICKPFSMKILVARVRRVLRRDVASVSNDGTPIQIHDIVIDPRRRQVFIEGEAIDLTGTEFALLHFLAGRAGWVMTRDQIIDAVRGKDYAVTDRAVDVQVVGLRKKLGSRAEYIQTVRGVGYRFKE